MNEVVQEVQSGSSIWSLWCGDGISETSSDAIHGEGETGTQLAMISVFVTIDKTYSVTISSVSGYRLLGPIASISVIVFVQPWRKLAGAAIYLFNNVGINSVVTGESFLRPCGHGLGWEAGAMQSMYEVGPWEASREAKCNQCTRWVPGKQVARPGTSRLRGLTEAIAQVQL